MGEIKARDDAFVAGTYARFPVELVSGSGSLVYGSDGKRYIDMGSGIGVTAFGIADPLWAAAVKGQVDALQHMSNLYYTEPCGCLAEMLCRKTGMKRVFFSNSGAEANECAIKVARKYAAAHKGAEYYTVITLENSFHGRTLTTLSATGQEHYHELFQPLTPGFVSVPAGDFDAFRQAAETHRAAAVLMECVQGEGGVLPVGEEYIRQVAAYAKEHDIVLMFDEVQTGNGRSGELYAYMHYGVEPDVVSTAKGLGGGLPIGATLMGEKVAEVLTPGDHGSTYGGNPVCCAGACSVIERLTPEFLAQVKKKSEYVFSAFRGAKGVKEVSGLGLMVGILPEEKAASSVVKAALDRGVLCLTAKNKVRLLPALNIPMEVLQEAVEALLAILAE